MAWLMICFPWSMETRLQLTAIGFCHFDCSPEGFLPKVYLSEPDEEGMKPAGFTAAWKKAETNRNSSWFERGQLGGDKPER